MKLEDLRNDLSAVDRQLVDLIADRIAELRSESANADHVPTSIGMVMPGYMDRERTRLEFAANLPNLSGSNFLESLRQRIDLPIAFDADCNGAAWGEFRFGAGRDVNRLIVATVGTGIGADGAGRMASVGMS